MEEDVWIGCNVTLLSGVTIGRGSTVAAGAVVAKMMPPYCICWCTSQSHQVLLDDRSDSGA
ncbi:DapH/DapD/GlmU-related protein [Bacteroides thetaiotaomicron]|uniref:DapH/DapD/GlmU-related protein n=1 Tax=Bacteroides thetaiotaomicron TaxID=818 RepID=UPI00202DDA6E|nr:hypothetical protein [Bacteroides thetaiotaomicron]